MEIELCYLKINYKWILLKRRKIVEHKPQNDYTLQFILGNAGTPTPIFASQGLRSALLICTLGIVRRIFEVTRFICDAASGSSNQSEPALQKAYVL